MQEVEVPKGGIALEAAFDRVDTLPPPTREVRGEWRGRVDGYDDYSDSVYVDSPYDDYQDYSDSRDE